MARENGLGVTKDVMEKIVLNVLSREWLGVVALDGESLATQVSYERNVVVWPAR